MAASLNSPRVSRVRRPPLILKVLIEPSSADRGNPMARESSFDSATTLIEKSPIERNAKA